MTPPNLPPGAQPEGPIHTAAFSKSLHRCGDRGGSKLNPHPGVTCKEGCEEIQALSVPSSAHTDGEMGDKGSYYSLKTPHQITVRTRPRTKSPSTTHKCETVASGLPPQLLCQTWEQVFVSSCPQGY